MSDNMLEQNYCSFLVDLKTTNFDMNNKRKMKKKMKKKNKNH
jgi:hypothetical protein